MFLLTCFGKIKCIEDMDIVLILGGTSSNDIDTKVVELYKREEEDIKCGLFSDLCIPDLPEELHRATAIYEENENRVLVCGGGIITQQLGAYSNCTYPCILYISVIGGVAEVIPNTNCYILNNESMILNNEKKRSWKTWDTSVIDMRHGSIMPFQGGYLAMGLAPEYLY